jgi:hypothetical protein
MYSILPQVLCTLWSISKLYSHKNNCKKQVVKKRTEKPKEKEVNNSKDRNNVRDPVFNAGLQARHFLLKVETEYTELSSV